ncbi:MAG: hypothetical protein IPO86_09900 [Saprospiraceae bacterium]|nr:hypothetical protein [Saprospiraceae bacterium]
MEKILNYSFSIISGLAFIIAIYCTRQISNIKSISDQTIGILKQININNIKDTSTTINIKELNAKIADMQFQQESYTEMLGRQSDWFILYVTILFGLFGLIGFGYFISKVKKVKKECDDTIATQKKDYRMHLKDFTDLKVKIFDNIGNVYLLLSESMTTDFSMAFKFRINSIEHFLFSYEISKSKYRIETVKANLEYAIQIISEIEKNNDSINLFSRDMKIYGKELINVLKKVMEIDDKNIESHCSDCIYKINFYSKQKT